MENKISFSSNKELAENQQYSITLADEEHPFDPKIMLVYHSPNATFNHTDVKCSLLKDYFKGNLYVSYLLENGTGAAAADRKYADIQFDFECQYDGALDQFALNIPAKM